MKELWLQFEDEKHFQERELELDEELLQDLYDMVNNENLCEDLQDKFNILEDMCERNFPKDKEDDYMSALCNLEHAAFMAGANMVLDFIAGKEV